LFIVNINLFDRIIQSAFSKFIIRIFEALNKDIPDCEPQSDPVFGYGTYLRKDSSLSNWTTLFAAGPAAIGESLYLPTMPVHQGNMYS
jgi:hypothetical protein